MRSLRRKKCLRHVYGSRDSNSPEDWNDYILVQEMERVTNVHFEWELIEGSTYQERKNVMINSGTLPDIIKDGMSVLELARYGQEGLFIEIGELQEKYCPQLMHFYEINPVFKAAWNTDHPRHILWRYCSDSRRHMPYAAARSHENDEPF